MRKRRKTSPAEDLMDLVALLPWWLGVALALLSYCVLHGVVDRPLPTLQTGKQIGDAVPTMLWQGLATGGQYLLPFICLMGALVSVLRRRKRRALLDTAVEPAARTRAKACRGRRDARWGRFQAWWLWRARERQRGADGVDLMLTKAARSSWCSASSGRRSSWV